MYLRAELEREFLVGMRKGERAVLAVDVAWGARRAAAPRAEPEHDRNMDLAAAAEAIGDCKKWQRIFLRKCCELLC